MFWMPDQVRHDESGTFYESIKKHQQGSLPIQANILYF